MLKEGDKLKCHNNVTFERQYTVNKYYEIIKIEYNYHGVEVFEIGTEIGYSLFFSIYPDKKNLSYKNWFVNVKEENKN